MTEPAAILMIVVGCTFYLRWPTNLFLVLQILNKIPLSKNNVWGIGPYVSEMRQIKPVDLIVKSLFICILYFFYLLFICYMYP